MKSKLLASVCLLGLAHETSTMSMRERLKAEAAAAKAAPAPKAPAPAPVHAAPAPKAPVQAPQQQAMPAQQAAPVKAPQQQVAPAAQAQSSLAAFIQAGNFNPVDIRVAAEELIAESGVPSAPVNPVKVEEIKRAVRNIRAGGQPQQSQVLGRLGKPAKKHKRFRH